MSDAMQVCLLSKSGVYRISWFDMMKRQEHSIELVQVGRCEPRAHSMELVRVGKCERQEHKRERALAHKHELVHKP